MKQGITVVRDFREEGGDARKGMEEVFKQVEANVKVEVEEVKMVRIGKEERRDGGDKTERGR